MKIFIHRNGQVYGPYSKISIHSFLKEGLASPTDWAWAEGRKQWVKLEDLLENGQDENLGILLSEKDHAKVKKIKELVEKSKPNLLMT